jgi:hypothetical protein
MNLESVSGKINQWVKIWWWVGEVLAKVIIFIERLRSLSSRRHALSGFWRHKKEEIFIMIFQFRENLDGFSHEQFKFLILLQISLWASKNLIAYINYRKNWKFTPPPLQIINEYFFSHDELFKSSLNLLSRSICDFIILVRWRKKSLKCLIWRNSFTASQAKGGCWIIFKTSWDGKFLIESDRENFCINLWLNYVRKYLLVRESFRCWWRRYSRGRTIIDLIKILFELKFSRFFLNF